MTSDSVIYEGEGLNLRDLARVRSGTHTKQIQTSEALGSQLAYIAETRREHGYSRAVDRLFDLVLDYVSHAEEAWRAGRSVIWTSAPLMPVYYAHNVLPIPISELGRLGSADAIGIAEDAFQIPKESCSMVGAILGEFYLRTGRTPPRLVVYNAQCEPLNLAWELLKDEGFDVFRVEAICRPNAADDPERVAQLQAYFVEELKRTVLWLTGKPVDENRLAAEIRRANRIIGKMRRVLRLRLHNPLYIRSLATMYTLAGMTTYYGKPDEYEEVLDLLVEELEAAAAAPEPHDKLVRLAWVGGRGQEFGVYKAVDDAGGAITAWHSTVDDWTRDYREDLPPLEAFADYTITGRTLGSPVRQRQRIEEYLPEFGAQGILFYGYIGCSFGSVHREIQGEYFHRLGLPSIFLEGSFQVGPPTGQLLTRIRAFVEMLSR
jgi:benzoyl-CoA reductase/2-hydroxyglutaryl-CoA dehydratase subunit BcrC/BadD/HgdB